MEKVSGKNWLQCCQWLPFIHMSKILGKIHYTIKKQSITYILVFLFCFKSTSRGRNIWQNLLFNWHLKILAWNHEHFSSKLNISSILLLKVNFKLSVSFSPLFITMWASILNNANMKIWKLILNRKKNQQKRGNRHHYLYSRK